MNRFIRAVVYTLYYCFAYWLPESTFPLIGEVCRKIRGGLCKCLFKNHGRWINVDRRVYFGWNDVSLGENSGLGTNMRLQNSSLVVGNNVMIGRELHIVGGGHYYLNKEMTIGQQGAKSKSQLEIEDDVWIGERVTILSNVTNIGKGSVIGACSVVTHNVPSYAVVAGNPARVIKYRT